MTRPVESVGLILRSNDHPLYACLISDGIVLEEVDCMHALQTPQFAASARVSNTAAKEQTTFWRLSLAASCKGPSLVIQRQVAHSLL